MTNLCVDMRDWRERRDGTDDGSRSEVRGFRNFELCVPRVSLGVPFSPVHWI